MSGRASKRDSYWLREKNKKQTDAKKNNLEKQHTIEHPSKHKTKLENCIFVEKSVEKAQRKKIMENAIIYSKTSKDFSYPSVLRNYQLK